MSDVWYPPTDGCPGIAVPVIVMWNGRELRAARWADAGGYRGWITFQNGVRENLPPKGEERRWGDEPDAWRPEHPEKWKAPLPSPMVSCEPQMWSSRTKFQAVEDATAAELAREMEADRADAQRGNSAENGRLAGERHAETRQWWRDGTLVSYSPKGTITKREAEGRMMRALAWCGAGAGLTLKERTPLTLLANVSDFMDGADQPVIKFEPLPQDVRDFEIAMAWFAALYPIEMRPTHHDAWEFNAVQRILLWRAKAVPLSFTQIGRHLGVSEQAARQRYAGAARQTGAVERVWRAANGFKIYDHLTVENQIDLLRGRNRAHRTTEARG